MKTNLLLEKLPATWQSLPTPLRRRPAVLWAGVAAILVLAAAWWFKPSKAGDSATSYHEVKRNDLTVSFVEGGALAAVNEVSVRNEVEGIARIIWIVPEGSYVKKGDLLVELDSSQAQDQVNLQQIAYEKAVFAFEAARAQLDIQKSATNSDFLAADLKLKFAKLDRDKYLQGQQLVDLMEASNKLVQAEAQLVINEETFRNSTNLAAKGYETKQKADGDRLAVLNSQNSLVVATNGIWILQQFDVRKQREKFDADVMQAEQELERTVTQNERKMAQALADLSTQEKTLALSEEKLKRDKKNLAGTKIYAPQDGLVVYQVSDSHWSSESLVEGGATVRNRQELIKLPDLSRMKVTIKVHESHINTVRVGQPAFVVLDSNPDVRYRGVVEKVAPLPDTQARWGNPNLKVYNTDIYITDALPNVKPGVSAKAEVVITNISAAISVPIQAVTTLKGKPVVYLAGSSKPEPRPVELGMFNTKFIEVTKGVQERDRVLLSPPFDVNEKDLAGSLVAEGEARGLTNTPVRKPVDAVPPGLAGPGARPGRQESGLTGGPPDRQAGSAEPRRPGGEVIAGGAEPRAGGGPDRLRPRLLETPSREDILKRFDKDGDGKLNAGELAAMQASLSDRPEPPGGRDQGDKDKRERSNPGAERGPGERRGGGGQRGAGAAVN